MRILLFIALFAASANAADRKSAIEGIVQPAIEQGYAVGMVVGVLEGGQTQVFGFGKTAANGKTPDSKTVFEIGSISKVFTASTLAVMVEKKQLSLDDPVRKYLPASAGIPPSPEGAKEITLFDLATQSSGLPRMPDNFRPADPKNPYADYTPAKLYEFLAKQTLVKKPDAKYLYSNLGVGLLGHVLELRAGKSYGDLVVENICKPLGMSDTAVELSADMKARLAQGHNVDGDAVPNWDLVALAGAGALRSTGADMLRFLAANLDPPEAFAAAFKNAHTIRAPITAPPGSIALAWHVKADRKTWWHNGGTAGYTTYISFNPERKTAVLVLINTGGSLMNDIGARLERLLAGEFYEPLKLHKSITLAFEVLDRYTGTYDLGIGKFTVRRNGNRLVGQLAGQAEVVLYAESETEFFVKPVDAQATFTKDASGAVTGLVWHQAGRDTPGKRVP
jgi:CubicO group peptidase (beta-lactamase class C family)